MSVRSKHLTTLERRLEFLEDKRNRGDASEGAMRFVDAEISALQWALPQLRGENASGGGLGGPGAMKIVVHDSPPGPTYQGGLADGYAQGLRDGRRGR